MVGDMVGYSSQGNWSKRVVTRVTKTQVVVGTTKYNRATGRCVGASLWNHDSIKPMSDRVRALILDTQRRIHLVHRMHDIKFMECTSDQLRRALDVLLGRDIRPAPDLR